MSLFSSTTEMTSIVLPAPGGTISAPVGYTGTFDFADKLAYLWIKNSDSMVVDAGSEWLLVRGDWVFPTATDCCDTRVFQFSSGSLAGGNTPVWGGQGGVEGSGFYSSFEGNLGSLQTYSIVPEPSSALIAFVIVLGTVMRRDRGAAVKA